MDQVSDVAEIWLRLLADEFWLEEANHAIGAQHACQFSSSSEARLVMLRRAYLKGFEDATKPAPDFDADLKAVEEANEHARNERATAQAHDA